MWRLFFHPLVLKEDLKGLDPSVRKQIFRAIEKKLPVDPKGYGRPLSGQYAGLWRLRIGEYRAIYWIEESKIDLLVVKIGIRRDFEVYQELAVRLKRVGTRG